jgi:hypothetical protein
MKAELVLRISFILVLFLFFRCFYFCILLLDSSKGMKFEHLSQPATCLGFAHIGKLQPEGDSLLRPIEQLSRRIHRFGGAVFIGDCELYIGGGN